MRRSVTIILYGALLGLILAVLGTGLRARPAYAQTGWSAPFDVSDDQDGWFADLAVDGAGAVHVIWGGTEDTPAGDQLTPQPERDLLSYRVQRDGAWSPVNHVAFTCLGGYTVRNSIVANPDGRLNVLVRTCTDVSTIAAPAAAAQSAQAWTPFQRIGASYYNAIAADSKGNLHALYNESLFGSAEGSVLLSEVFYRRSTDGGQTWSVRTNLARLPGGDERMQIKVDAQDRVHVVWDHGSDWYSGVDSPEYGVYRRSDDGGATWSEPVLLGTADGPNVQTTLGLTLEGNPVVVYRSAEDTLLYFQTSPDGGASWTVAEPIPGLVARSPGERSLDSYSMATDGANRVHLIAAGFPEASEAGIPMLLHLTWDGQRWSAPEVVAATQNRPLWPRLVAAGNQLHAVWFSYTDASGWGQRRIWYSSRVVDGPALPPAPPVTRPAQAPPAPAPAPGEESSEAALAPGAGLEAATTPAPIAPSSGTHTFSDRPPPGAVGNQTLLIPLLALVPVLGLCLVIVVLALWHRGRSD